MPDGQDSQAALSLRGARLVLEDGTVFAGAPFGGSSAAAGEVVFNTGMVGYPESLTDPSYRGQILVLCYPLSGNYGVPAASSGLESDRIQVSALVVAEHSASYSHHLAHCSLDGWLREHGVPGLCGVDTRLLTQKLRGHGSMLGRVAAGSPSPVEVHAFVDPNQGNLLPQVSVERPREYGEGDKRVVVIDCGCKNAIVRALLARRLRVTVVPWDWPADEERADGFLISNGPGDPARAVSTIDTARRLLSGQRPVFGICLGSQILALAAGARTYKLKYGHRGQNQPCVMVGTKRCFITSQNHGYAVDDRTLPPDWLPWFFNANDGTNEGIRHKQRPFMGVQFHPEASPGPLDTRFLFDDFVRAL